ncbi:MAG: hypothetical protein B7C54_10025 [Acidimicrobiales bacterium mtb01]|nr:maleylpyruvate isomerase family mycothiol-dependent enzyme [Actinomycetota bacterium]TEX45419.1 MAG: hypothetical protein B7C54_10025 [Acidimicrobiales bacterium mtb01]
MIVSGEELRDQYRASRLRMETVAASLSDDDARKIVSACPEWTVRDLFSHVTGIAADLSGGKPPQGDSQAWVDRQIDERRDRSLSSVVDEWHEKAPAFEEMIAASPKGLWGLTYDTVVHEHDLRTAVDRPGDRDSEGVRLAARLGLRLVKMDLAKSGLGAFRAVIDGEEVVVGEGEPELTLRTSAFECLRLLGSRRTRDEMRAAPFEGDLDRYLAGIVHMDLPVRSLGE